MIEAIPAVKSKSAAAAPGIATGPRSVVQVPMADGEPTVLGEVSVSVSMLPAALVVSDEEEKDEDAESGIVMMKRTWTTSTVRHRLRRRSAVPSEQ